MQNRRAFGALDIGLLAWDYPPTGTGLATAAREIAESLAMRSHRVRVLALDADEDRRVGGVTVIGAARWMTDELRMMRKRAGIGHLAAPIAFAACVRDEHRRRRFDIVEGSNWYAPGVCLPALGLPLITRCSTPVSSTASIRRPRDVFDCRAAALLERRQARASAGIASNTAHHALKMASLYGVAGPGGECQDVPHRIIGLSLPPGTETDLPAPPAGPPYRLLFVGRPTHRKGFDAITDAARALGSAFEVRLIGVEPDGTMPSNVKALGRVANDDMAAELRAAHAVLAPSRYESFGLVYQEAIAAGRPLVACADDPAARAFVATQGTGVLAATCTGTGVAAAARALLTTPARYDAARAACAVARHRFSRETLGAQTETLYRAVLQRRNGVNKARSSPALAVSVAPSDIAP